MLALPDSLMWGEDQIPILAETATPLDAWPSLRLGFFK